MQINFSVKQQIITAECPGRLVIAGSKGHVYAKFSLDEEWDGLTVTALFSNDYVPTGARSVVLTGNKPVEIPPEVLATGKLRASLVGVRDEGEYRLTTKFMDKPILVVRSGATSGDASNQSPELWEQVLALMGDLDELPTADKSSLVAAITEIFLRGGQGGGSGNVYSPDLDTIRVLDRDEYDALPTPRPENTVYLIRG